MLVRTIILVPLLIVSLLAMLPLLIFCALAGRPAPLLAFARGVIRMALAILGLRWSVSGLDSIDPGRPAVYMANHQSLFDGPILFLLIPRSPRVILKKSLLRIPILGQAMRFTGFVPVDRRGESGGKAAIAQAARLMKERECSFLIFPEGTRTWDGRLGEFRRGGFFLAAAAKAPIVPVTIDGAFDVMPRGRKIPRRGRIRFVFHPALDAADPSETAMAVCAERVRSAITSTLKGDAI